MKHEINFIKVVDTTMTIAHEYLDKGKDSFTSIFVDYQNKGRGRSKNREWNTSIEAKNLLLSTIIKREDLKIQSYLIPLTVGVAIRETLRDLYRVKAEIKWPNDLILNNKKIAGVVCESNSKGIVIGLGLNMYEKNFKCESYKMEPSSLLLEKVALGIDSELERNRIINLFLDKLELFIGNLDFIKILNSCCYKKGEVVVFSCDSADNVDNNDAIIIKDVLSGVNNDGSLRVGNKDYYSGELLVNYSL